MSKLNIEPIVCENMFSQISYLCFDEKCMFMIDCGCSFEALNDAIFRCGLQNRVLDGILLTHCHFDHIMGLKEVWDRYKCDVYMAEWCEDFIYDQIRNASAHFGGFKSGEIKSESIKTFISNDVLRFGDIEINVIRTEGHSICSTCFKVGEYLFTGDTVLEGTIGRTDLFGGNFNELKNSLKELVKLSYKIAYPWHGKPMDKALIDGIVNMYTN